MATMASPITSLTIVYSTVHSGAVQKNINISVSVALCGEFTGDRKRPVTQKMVPFDDVIMEEVRVSCLYDSI